MIYRLWRLYIFGHSFVIHLLASGPTLTETSAAEKLAETRSVPICVAICHTDLHHEWRDSGKENKAMK